MNRLLLIQLIFHPFKRLKKNLMGPETQRDERIEINFVKILSGNLILEYLNAYYCSLTL